MINHFALCTLLDNVHCTHVQVPLDASPRLTKIIACNLILCHFFKITPFPAECGFQIQRSWGFVPSVPFTWTMREQTAWRVSLRIPVDGNKLSIESMICLYSSLINKKQNVTTIFWQTDFGQFSLGRERERNTNPKQSSSKQ